MDAECARYALVRMLADGRRLGFEAVDDRGRKVFVPVVDEVRALLSNRGSHGT